MPRAAATALALGLALAACDRGAGGPICPGERIGAFRFEGTRVPAGDPSIAGFDPSPELVDCSAAVGYPDLALAADQRELPAFDAALTHDPVTAAAALCKSGGIVLYGQHTGPRYVLETGTSGAALGTCAETCTAGLRLVVAGDLETSPEGEATRFVGGVFETMSALEGSACGETCTLPCEARYAVTGSR